jgi:hypothetical protein
MREAGMSWLTNGPLPDWIVEEPDRRFGSIAEAWVEVEGYTHEISAQMTRQVGLLLCPSVEPTVNVGI